MQFPPNNGCDSGDRPTPSAASDEAPQAPGASPRDAESGNTASQTCKGIGNGLDDLFEVVWQGIDTLELTYAGQTDSEVDEKLAELKALAQGQEIRTQALAQFALGERPFEVADKSGGRFFAYLLKHPEMRLVVASAKAKRIPLACVTLLNQFLVSVGPEAAEAAARPVVDELGTIDGSELVKRCDLAVDIATDTDIGARPADSWVTRAERLDPHYVGGWFTGWSIGVGADVSARVYDKKREIDTSGKLYFLELWQSGGWFPADPVVRVEFQFKRAALNRFGLKTLADVVKARPALWAYATRDWARLATPNASDQTRSRWPLEPFWERVQAIEWAGNVATLERKRPSTNAPSDKVLARMFKAVATAVMARDGLRTLHEAGERLTSLLMAQLQRIEHWEGAPADTMIEEAVMFKRRKYCLPVKA